MAFRDDVHKRARGKCECAMKVCTQHTGRCSATLRGAWEVHRITAGGPYTLSDVMAMCQKCHRNARAMDVAGRGTV